MANVVTASLTVGEGGVGMRAAFELNDQFRERDSAQMISAPLLQDRLLQSVKPQHSDLLTGMTKE
ncbi:hypothetical protein K875_00046 [Mycobacterium [tuberculosis] TKK-01-0051]|uniref:Uncharacterized protein n=1 Tax=Mycobacterium [tuberculosis] TKK-01-0051 TaxID=1324261 RepID=A0A051UL71_9MYCO|nr:hypothetical protein K875_00046 [Mycobacterium [tuberculosis] TKK-01-0051]